MASNAVLSASCAVLRTTSWSCLPPCANRHGLMQKYGARRVTPLEVSMLETGPRIATSTTSLAHHRQASDQSARRPCSSTAAQTLFVRHQRRLRRRLQLPASRGGLPDHRQHSTSSLPRISTGFCSANRTAVLEHRRPQTLLVRHQRRPLRRLPLPASTRACLGLFYKRSAVTLSALGDPFLASLRAVMHK